MPIRPFLFAVWIMTLAGGASAQSSDVLSGVKTQADLDAAIAAAPDPARKSALQTQSAAILAAAAKKPHVEAVIATLEKAPGSFQKANVTPDALKKAFGADLALFDTLKMVNLSSSALGIKGKREVDPFDHAFYEHVGEIADLESLTILNTTAQNADLVPVAKLKNLKNLNITNQARMNDEGLALLAGLNQLEHFSFVGTSMTGQPFQAFGGWTKLKNCSFRGSKIDDEGLKQLCDHFPNLESLSLAHAQFTDAGAVNLAKLKKLKGFEIASRNATPECLRHLLPLPLESLQLGEGVGAPAGIAIIKDLQSLRRLTVTDAKGLTDADVTLVAGMQQLDHVEFGSLEINDERLPLLKLFRHLKSMRLVRYSNPYTPEIRAKVQETLPGVKLAFD